MRIVHLPNLYAPSVGGVQSLVRILSEAFAAGGDEVTVFTSNGIDTSAFYVEDPGLRIEVQSEVRNGVSIQRFPIEHRLHARLFGSLASGLGAATIARARQSLGARAWHRALRKRPFCPGLAAALIQLRPDLAVAFNSASSFTISCWLANAAAGIPYVVFPTLHTTATWAYDPWVVPVLQAADAVVVATRFERDHLVGRGVDPRAIEIVPPGIDPAAGRARGRVAAKRVLGLDSEPVVGCVGRQVAGKGIEILIRAMRHVWARRPTTQLMLAGGAEPSFEPTLAAELAQLQPLERARVVTIGAFSEAEAGDLFAACDIFALPSTVESFGIGYLEAWRQRTPVVAAAGGAPASFIRDGGDGFLVAPGRTDALAHALLRLLDDATLRNRLGDAGHARLADEFHADRMIERVRRVYDRVGGLCVDRVAL
jgi:glycosyltransferase involved in cell wall biosynthesis